MKSNINVTDLGYLGSSEWQSTAEEAVRRYNAHEELVAALELGLKYAESNNHLVEDTAMMHAALRKARGEV